MKLECKYRLVTMDEFFCDLTRDLDKLAGFKKDSLFKHYLLISHDDKKERRLPIRIPGGTVGEVCFNENNIITKITIDTTYVVKTYQTDVEQVINKKYVGTEIEFE